MFIYNNAARGNENMILAGIMNQDDEELADFIDLLDSNDCQVQEATQRVEVSIKSSIETEQGPSDDSSTSL